MLGQRADAMGRAVVARVSAALLLLLGTVGCDESTSSDPLAGNAALVITTDYQTGSYAAVRLSDHEVVPNIEVIHQDAVCRYDPVTGHPLIVARLGADAIDVVDTAERWQVIEEYSVGAGTNPQDIAVVAPDRAYVSRMGATSLLVVHPLDGTVLDEVDLTPYADDDGLAEPAGLYHRDGKVYALLLRLASLQPTDHSLLLVIDAATGEVEQSLELASTNPAGMLRYSAALDALVLPEPGLYGDHSDGGIELYYLATGELSGLLIDEQALGGDIVDAVMATETKGYAIVGTVIGTAGETMVVSFDLTTGTLTNELIVSDSWDHMSLELTPDGTELWVPERKLEAPGIRIFDVATDAELTSAPIDVGLPPFAICFVGGVS